MGGSNMMFRDARVKAWRFDWVSVGKMMIYGQEKRTEKFYEDLWQYVEFDLSLVDENFR